MRHSSERGTVLLLALLIMSSVVISSAGLGSLILNSLQQTRAIDNSIIAYYAAESGVEEALYAARRLDEVPDDASDQFMSGAKWERTISTTEKTIYATIPENSLLEVALFDPDDEVASLGIKVVKIDWDTECDGPCPVLSATLVSWQPQDPIIWDANAAVYKYTLPEDAVLSVDENKLYKLRLRAEKNDLNKVKIQAFMDEAQSELADLPGRIRITATGEHVGTRQRIIVSVPRRTPLSSVYDFVIFSECSIVKGGAGISCPSAL